MRIMRGLSSRFLPCGCLAGIYETYEGEVVGILDARGPACADRDHGLGDLVPVQPAARPNRAAPPAVDND
jgi:hypothetical protein